MQMNKKENMNIRDRIDKQIQFLKKFVDSLLKKIRETIIRWIRY